MDRLYIPTTIKSRINLSPNDIIKSRNIGIWKILQRKLNNKYSGTCIREGYIKKDSIKLQKKTLGKIRAEQFMGDATYEVIFQAQLYVPTIGSTVVARVEQINRSLGILAVSHPLQIIVIKGEDFMEDDQELETLNIGSYIRIKLLEFRIEQNFIFAVGKFEQELNELEQENYINKVQIIPNTSGEVDLAAMPPNLTLFDQPIEKPGDEVLIKRDQLHEDYAFRIYKEYRTIQKWLQDPKGKKPNPSKKWNQQEEAQLKVDWLQLPNTDPDLYQRIINVKNNDLEIARDFVNNYELVWARPFYNMRKIPIGGKIVYNNTIVQFGEDGGGMLEFDEPLSRAYFKLWEMLVDFKLLNDYSMQNINVLSLAEGPGGFLQAVLDYRKNQGVDRTQDTYRAITLKKPEDDPNSFIQDWSYKNTQKYQKILENEGIEIQLDYGADDTGDLTNPENLLQILKDYQDPDSKIQLVTADGDVGTENKMYEEMDNFKLIYGEIVAGLAAQAEGGSFVIKMKDMFTEVTNQMVQLLTFLYEEVWVTKPKTSRPSNSERYVVAMGFKGADNLEEYLLAMIQQLKEWNTNNFPNRQIAGVLALETDINENITKSLKESSQQFIKQQTEKLDMERDLLGLNNENVDVPLRIPERQGTIKTDQITSGRNWCEKYMTNAFDNPQPNVCNSTGVQLIAKPNCELKNNKKNVYFNVIPLGLENPCHQQILFPDKKDQLALSKNYSYSQYPTFYTADNQEINLQVLNP